MFIGVKAILCLFAVFIIHCVSPPSFSARFPFVGILQFWRNAFVLVCLSRLGGVVSFIRISVTYAHVGRVCVRLR